MAETPGAAVCNLRGVSNPVGNVLDPTVECKVLNGVTIVKQVNFSPENSFWAYLNKTLTSMGGVEYHSLEACPHMDDSLSLISRIGFFFFFVVVFGISKNDTVTQSSWNGNGLWSKGGMGGQQLVCVLIPTHTRQDVKRFGWQIQIHMPFLYYVGGVVLIVVLIGCRFQSKNAGRQ
mmetsp:Transcript_26550/g.48179  ORF Transcript_26550/g.48179 Transcript_26550/m.48179 type:complete len:176 (+) Transcript_26550:2905-3432(+)